MPLMTSMGTWLELELELPLPLFAFDLGLEREPAIGWRSGGESGFLASVMKVDLLLL